MPHLLYPNFKIRVHPWSSATKDDKPNIQGGRWSPSGGPLPGAAKRAGMRSIKKDGLQHGNGQAESGSRLDHFLLKMVENDQEVRGCYGAYTTRKRL